MTEHPELHSYFEEVDWRVEEAYARWLRNQ